MTGNLMRAAVVGCGPWGQAHMRALIANPEVELVAVCGRSAGTLRATQMSKDGTNRISPRTTVRQPTTTQGAERPAPNAVNATRTVSA